MGPKEILLVDDEWDEVAILTFLLVAEGYRVQHASDGLRALQLLSKTAVDLVLTDYMMPKMDGCDLLRRMRASKETATTPVLMISALPEVLVRMKCGPVGAFLHKPFPPKLLLSLVRDLLVPVT
jgi:DNA-binding response OmpR family regulator